MTALRKLTPDEVKAMADDIMRVCAGYSSVADEGLRFNRVEFSGNKKTGIEVFASDAEGNGLRVVKVMFNQA